MLVLHECAVVLRYHARAGVEKLMGEQGCYVTRLLESHDGVIGEVPNIKEPMWKSSHNKTYKRLF